MSALHRRVRTRSLSSLRDLHPDQWNHLSGAASLYLSYDWLRYVERKTSADTEYLIVTRSPDVILGAIPLYFVNVEDNIDYRSDHVLGGTLPGRYLLAGTRRAYMNDVLLDPSLEDHKADEVLDRLLHAADQRAADLGLDGVLFLYLTTNAARRLHQIGSHLRPFLLNLDTDLPAVGNSFEDYLSWLGSRRAYNVRKELMIFQKAGYDSAIERLTACWHEGGQLVSNVQRRHGHDEHPEMCRDSLREQADALNEHSLVFTARRNGRLIAMALFYAWRKILHGRLVGFDYDGMADAREYFNLFYYQPLVWAYQHGYRTLHLGRESYPAKLRRGARPAALWAVLSPGTGPSEHWRCWNTARLAEWKTRWHIDDLDVPSDWLA